MDKYLLEILKNVNTIIIPGLGALTITNHDTGEIMFMSYLKHDDGKLVSYIVENEGMDELDAKNLIAKYVREIQLTVDKGESYDMFQFGSFFKNGDEIDFKNWEGDKTIETKEIIEEKIVEEKEVTESSEIKEEEAPNTNDSNSEKEEAISPSISEKSIEEKQEEDKSDPVVLHLKEEVEEQPKKEFNILEKEEQATTAAKLEKLKSEKEKSKEKKKKNPGFWMLMVLIVLIVSGGVYFGLNYDQLKQHVPFLADKKETVVSPEVNEKEISEENSTEEETLENNEEVIEEEVIPEQIEEEVVEPETENETVINTNSGSDLPFHIIAGAFSSEDNANRLGEKLKAEGYNVKVGPGRGMTLVSIKSFATRAEAQSGLTELKSVTPNGWIYEWK